MCVAGFAMDHMQYGDSLLVQVEPAAPDLTKIKKVFDENNNKACLSQDNDPELLINVIFSEPVNIRGIFLISLADGTFDQIFLFMNKVNFSYDVIDNTAD